MHLAYRLLPVVKFFGLSINLNMILYRIITYFLHQNNKLTKVISSAIVQLLKLDYIQQTNDFNLA